MNLKLIAIIGSILILFALSVGLFFQITKTTESQKGQVINNFTFEPHQTFGCARYTAPEKMLTDARPKAQVKK